MIKNEKGVTLISLVIVVALMTIISSTVVNLSLKRFEINKLRKMYTDIELLQDKVANYYLKYETLPVLKNSSNTSVQYTYSSLNFEKNSEDNSDYYILDLNAIGELALNYGKAGFNAPNASEDVYIINEKSHIIYYVKGKKLNGKTYHTLVNNNPISDTIPPSSPEIKVISGTKSDNIYITKVEVEIIAGKDGNSGIAGTTYSLDGGTTWENFSETSKLITISENGTYIIKAKTYDNSNNYSEEIVLDIEIKKVLGWTQDKTTVTNGEVTLQVGQTVTGYDAGVSSYTGEWAVLGAENRKLLLVSTKNVQNSVKLKGRSGDTANGYVAGYDNGIEKLDEICQPYLNSSLADKVRSINVDDINRVTGYNPETAEYGAGYTNQYGNLVEYKLDRSENYSYSFLTYVVMYSNTKATGIEDYKESNYVSFENVYGIELKYDNLLMQPAGSLSVSCNYYCYLGSKYLTNTKSSAYKLLFSETATTDGFYWLANQYEEAQDGYAEWGIRVAKYGTCARNDIVEFLH